MSRTLVVSDETYESLEKQARRREMESVEKFLEELSKQLADEESAERQRELTRRGEVGRRMRELREKVFQENGLMPDSIEIVREDRMR